MSATWRILVLFAAWIGCALDASAQQPALAAPPAGASRQLVIPFENATREARVHWLTEGSAVILTDDLLALGAPAITRDDRLRAFDRLRVPSVATLSDATVIRLGQVVGASQVVVGKYELQGDRLTVRARTIRLEAGRSSPEIVESGRLADLFTVYARVARRVVPDSRVSPEAMEAGHPPLSAFEQYIKGLLATAPATKISFLRQALKAAPTFHRPRLALWEVYTDQSEHLQALTITRDVPRDHRVSRPARFRGAVSLMHLARYQEAYEALSELHRSAPDPALLNNLGVVQLRRPAGAAGDRAVSFFTEATRLDGNDSDLFFNLGYAYWLERDLPSAMLWLREAVRRNPADDGAHYVLGVALQAAGNVTEAAREKELAKRLSATYADWEAKQPGSNAPPRGMERIKLDIDIPAALRVDSVIVAAGQRDQQELAQFHLAAGRRLHAAGRDAEAIAELRRAVYLAPYQSEAHLLLGRLYLRDGRPRDAIDALQISLWIDERSDVRLALADAYIAAKEVDAARRELQRVIDNEPSNAAAREMLQRLP